MYKLIASLLAVVITALSIAIMAALVDDSKLTAQQVGQYRAEHFVAVDDVIEVPQIKSGIILSCGSITIVKYSEIALLSMKTPIQQKLATDSELIIRRSKLINELKQSLFI
ncbi:hypothetical protein ACMAZF_02685 [Psychrobium sp. nBUS_13]|uniref:hypothetical protein n=1 Tax=Psychrobium sp. nBUS_13 TaxID=3395319 RepID=UPI003EB85DF1